MAGDLSGETRPTGSPVTEDLPPKAPRRLGQSEQSFAGRFRLVYVALALLLVGAGVGFWAVVANTGSGGGGGGAWSPWQPSKDGSAGQREIADFVARHYRLAGGSQLVGVFAGPPQVQNVSIAAIAIRIGPGNSQGSIRIVPASGGVMYVLCGLGSNCSIPSGQPTLERARLLRREALELALYTFKYQSSIKSVIAFLPPKPGSQPTFTLFFARDDLKSELKHPLATTLRPTMKLVEGEPASAESGVVDRLTAPRLFQYSFQQTQSGAAVLVLAPIAA